MFFVLALSYKQMELYHALPFFFYLLGLCLRKEPLWSSALMKLFKIGAVVLFTFYIIWFPFLNDLNQIEQVLLHSVLIMSGREPNWRPNPRYDAIIIHNGLSCEF